MVYKGKPPLHTLGSDTSRNLNNELKLFIQQHKSSFLWFHEILKESQEACGSSVIELLPKTPSTKRAKRRVKQSKVSEGDVSFEPPSKRGSVIELLPKTPPGKRAKRKVKQSKVSESDDVFHEPPAKRSFTLVKAPQEKIIEETPPKKSYRTRAASKSTAVKPNTSQTRGRKKMTTSRCEEPSVVSAKEIETTSYESAKRHLPNKNQVKNTPENAVNLSDTHKNVNFSNKPGPGHVKHKVTAYEELIEANSPTKTPQRLCLSPTPESEESVPETPEDCKVGTPTTPATVVCETTNRPSVVDGNLNKTLTLDPENTMNTSVHRKRCRRSTRSGHRTSLKSLYNQKPVNSRLRLKKKVNLETSKITTDEVISANSDIESQSSAESVQEEIKEPSIPVEASSSSDKHSDRRSASLTVDSRESLTCVSMQMSPKTTESRLSVTETCISSDEKNLVRHIKSEKENDLDDDDDDVILISDTESPKNSDKMDFQQTSSAIESCRNVEVMETESEPVLKSSTHTKQRKITTTSESTTSEDEAPAKSTRTKQRKNKAVASSSDSGEELQKTAPAKTRTKQRKNTAASSASSADEELGELDSGIQSEKSTHSVESDGPRCTRSKMRKPQTKSGNSDNSENEDQFAMPEAPPMRMTRTKTRKRQLDEDDSSDVSLSKRSCTELEDTSHDLTCEKSSSDDEHSENEVSNDSLIVPSHYNKSLQSFQHNLSTKIRTPGNFTPGIVRSFIRRNTPPPKLTNKEEMEKKKKELQEKQKKDQARLAQRDALLKMRIEEQRRKREERMKKAADLRSQKEKNDLEKKNKNQKTQEEKRQLTEKLREEQQKEEREKQRIRMKKLQEVEERRKQEEEERQRKIREQEEEDRRNQEIMQKKKEAEIEERQRRIMEEKRRQEERMAELEKEREAEKERLKRQLEEDKNREVLRQRQKEEKEKAIARAQAERDKLERERKLQKEIHLKKAEEAKQARLKWEEEQREKKRKENMELQNMIRNHNASLAKNCPNKCGTLPNPNLNTTHNVSNSNPNSYPMTPVRKYKLPSEDNYDISDIRSDDSTDDEAHPHKKIPAWATGPNLKALLINQHYNPPDLESMFEPIEPPDLNELFVKKKARFNKRTSSAHWDSPILRPTNNVFI